MGLALLALGDIHRCAAQSNDRAGLVAQRLDMQVVPTGAKDPIDRDFAALGLTAVEHLALERGQRRPITASELHLIPVTEEVL